MVIVEAILLFGQTLFNQNKQTKIVTSIQLLFHITSAIQILINYTYHINNNYYVQLV